MVKFSSEYKEKVVLDYLNGGGGTYDLAKKYGIGSHRSILNWVNQYKKYGDKAFDVGSPKSDYDGNFKVEVLEWMRSNGASLPETALHFNISDLVQSGRGRGNLKTKVLKLCLIERKT
jgi:transposase